MYIKYNKLFDNNLLFDLIINNLHSFPDSPSQENSLKSCEKSAPLGLVDLKNISEVCEFVDGHEFSKEDL